MINKRNVKKRKYIIYCNSYAFVYSYIYKISFMIFLTLLTVKNISNKNWIQLRKAYYGILVFFE